MGASVAGLLILAVFLASSLMTSRTALFGQVALSNATKDSARLVGERARTVVGITSVTGSGACDLSVVVENTGATSFNDMTHMDVIAQFPTGLNPAQALVYNPSGTPALGQWTVVSITGAYEIGNLNPGESLTLDLKLTLVEPGQGVVTVGTPNGVVDTASFGILTPC